MSNETAVSMRELEMESAELLPSRETLHCCKYGNSGTTYSSSFTQVAGAVGLINVLSGDNINIIL